MDMRNGRKGLADIVNATGRRFCRAFAPALLLPMLVAAEENTFAIPKDVYKAKSAWSWDILASNEWWSAGRVPQPGDSVTFTDPGGANPRMYLSRDVSLSNLATTATQFMLKGPGRILLETPPYATVKPDKPNRVFRLYTGITATVPVVWNTGMYVNLNASSAFAESLTILSGIFAMSSVTADGIYASGVVTGTRELKGRFSYPSEYDGAFLSINGGTFVATNASEFGGAVLMNEKGAFAFYGGTEPLATNAANPELVASGLIAQFDASDLTSFTFTNGNRVCAWRSKVGDLVATPLCDGDFPWYTANDLGTNGIVDFGPSTTELWSQHDATALKFSASLATAQTVFYVMDTQMGGGWLLSTAAEGQRNFTRGADASGNRRGVVRAAPWAVETANPDVLFRSNGTAYDMSVREPCGTYEILTLANPTPFAYPIDGLAFDYNARTSTGSGHQRIAEFLAYDRQLDADEIARVEAYLYRKWLCGRNALRHAVQLNQGTFDIGLPFCDGYEAHLQHVFGRGGVTKQGPGTLVLDHPREVGDRVSVTAGTLVVPDTVETTRTTEAPAGYATDGLLLHLDATAADTLATNETGDVVEWRSGDGIDNRLVPGVEGETRGIAPFRRPNVFNGKTMVDFGALQSVTFMDLSNRITNARTVLMVADGRMGGGNVLADTSTGNTSSFARGGQKGAAFRENDLDAPLFYPATKMEAWSNGEMIAPFRRGLRGVPEILTFINRSKDVVIGRIGMERAQTLHSGGLAVGELLVWNRVLSGEELAQAYRHLQERWMDNKGPTLKDLCASGDGAVEPRPAIRVGTLSGSGKLAAKGGTVTVDGFADFTGALSSEADGVWNIVSTNGTVATSNPVTDGLLAHFDPSASATVATDGNGVVTGLTAVNDAALTAAPLNAAYGPYLKKADATDIGDATYVSCGTNAVLDCGGNTTGNPRGLRFSQTFTNVHTAVAIVGGQYVKTSTARPRGLFGSTLFDYAFPHENSIQDSALLGPASNTNKGQPDVLYAEGWLNGRRVVPSVEKGYGDYQICTFIWPRRMALDQLGYVKKNGAEGGGQVYGEFLMWNRCLTERERKAVEAYLSLKWFGRVIHGFTAPGLPNTPALAAGDRNLALGAAAGETSGVGAVSGSGTLTKTGAGTLEFQGSLSEMSGDIVIRGGTVKYAAVKASDETVPVTAGLLARFDAEENVFTNDAGVVTNWQACAGRAPYDRYAATPFEKNNCPWPVVTNGLNGHAWIDFGPYGVQGNGLYFDPVTHPENVLTDVDGANRYDYGSLSNCQTSILMFNAERGGGTILGSVGTCFARYGGNGSVYSNYAFDYYSSVNCTGFYVDGDAHTALETRTVTTLKNGWQVLEIQKTADNAVAGFAHERGLHYYFKNDRVGGQGLAEALFYDRALTAEERIQLRTYLYHKYRGTSAPESGTLDTMYADAPNVRSLRVDAGSTLDLNGCTNTVATLCCAGGSVTGGALVVTEKLALVPGEELSVAGAVCFGDGVTVSVPDGWRVRSGTYRLLSATAFVNAEAMRGQRMTLEQDGKTRKARFDVQGSRIDLVIYKMGTVLLLR